MPEYIPDFLRGLLRQDVPRMGAFDDPLILYVEREAMRRYRAATPAGRPWQDLSDAERLRWVAHA